MLWGSCLKGLEVGDIEIILSNNQSLYEKNVDPYGEDEVEDITAMQSGLIFKLKLNT